MGGGDDERGGRGCGAWSSAAEVRYGRGEVR